MSLCKFHGGHGSALTGVYCHDCHLRDMTGKRVELRRFLRTALTDDQNERLNINDLTLEQLQVVKELIENKG